MLNICGETDVRARVYYSAYGGLEEPSAVQQGRLNLDLVQGNVAAPATQC